MKSIVERIEAASGIAGLADLLATRIEPTDLQSLLMDVYRRRSGQRTPAQLLAEFRNSRFVRPAASDPRDLIEWERVAFAALDEAFVPIELSPLTPLGTCAAMAGVSQDWSVATVRNNELVSDVTNVLALEAALRRKAAPRTDIHLAASQRVMRPQAYRDPRLLPHFRLFAMVSGGRDRGSFAFEADAAGRQVDSYIGAFQRYFGASVRLRVSWTVDPGPAQTSDLRIGRLADLCAVRNVELVEDAGRTSGRDYYAGFSFHVHGRVGDGDLVQLVDGGTRRLAGTPAEQRQGADGD